jgi:hypothetical protein
MPDTLIGSAPSVPGPRPCGTVCIPLVCALALRRRTRAGASGGRCGAGRASTCQCSDDDAAAIMVARRVLGASPMLLATMRAHARSLSPGRKWSVQVLSVEGPMVVYTTRHGPVPVGSRLPHAVAGCAHGLTPTRRVNWAVCTPLRARAARSINTTQASVLSCAQKRRLQWSTYSTALRVTGPQVDLQAHHEAQAQWRRVSQCRAYLAPLVA